MGKRSDKREVPPGVDGHEGDGAVGALASFPFSHETWMAVCGDLGLRGKLRELAELVLKGKRDRSIADEMGISTNTVRTYLNRIFDRAGVKGRVEFIVLGFTKAQKYCISGSADRSAYTSLAGSFPPINRTIDKKHIKK